MTAYEQAQQFKAALARRDDAATKLITSEYQGIYGRLLRQLTSLNNQIAERRRMGLPVSQGWLFQQERYNRLLVSIDAEFRKLSGFTSAVTERRREIEAARGAKNGLVLIQNAADDIRVGASFTQLPVKAIEGIVANLRDDAPLGRLLNRFAPDAKRAASIVLRDGVALGWGPEKIAREMRPVLDVPRWRSVLIARTEAVRAYRQATLATYQENSDVVTGWYWVAAKSTRTCLNCISRDGSFYPVTKPLPGHPACRCVQIPGIKGVEPLPRQKASEWFAMQPAGVQQQMMGIAAHDLYKQGRIQLSDFEGERHSREWGDSTYQRSLKEILGVDVRKAA